MFSRRALLSLSGDQSAEAAMHPQYPQRRRNDSKTDGWVALFQALDRLHVDHHAPGHFAHGQAPPLARNGDVAPQLLQLVGVSRNENCPAARLRK
jgi:hypothetical protein